MPQYSVLDLLSRKRKIEKVYVDLTLEPSPSPSPSRSPSRPPSPLPSQTDDTVCCPVCNINMDKLVIEARESHVELCLLHPNSSKSIIISPSKSGKEKPSAQRKPKTKPRTSTPRKLKRTKPIPDFKILTFKDNHKLIVDGFQFCDHPEISQYFLSHFHSDHYIGITKNWDQGLIYTSRTTANLLQNLMNISAEKIIPIDLEQPYQLTEHIKVTLFDANHCPGGAIFLFQEFDDQERLINSVLHTGDFRVSSQHINRFQNIYLDQIYLDTTYLNPLYTFTQQDKVVRDSCDFISEIINSSIKKNSILNYFSPQARDYLILIGSYSIGKENFYIELAKTLDSKIFITEKRYKVLSNIENFPHLHLFECEKESTCKIQIVPIGKLSDSKFLSKFSSKNIIKIKPTGWSYINFQKLNKPKMKKGQSNLEILNETFKSDEKEYDYKLFLMNQFKKSSSLNIPYSEHSSFKELCMFCSFLKWGQVIPTVNVDNPSFSSWFESWKDFNLSKEKIEEYYNASLDIPT